MNNTVKLGPVRMVPGISKKNAYTLAFAMLVTIMSSVFMNSHQSYILEVSLKIAKEGQGVVTGILGTFHEIVVLLVVSPIGLLADKIGRRKIYAAGFFLIALGYFMYPRAASVEELIVYRIIFALGATCTTTMLSTTQADYAQNKYRGRMTGFGGFLNGLGVLIVNFGFLRLASFFSERGMNSYDAGLATYMTVAGICIFNGLVLAYGLKGGVPSKTTHKESIGTIMKRGLGAAKNPRIALSYAAGMVSRGDLVVISAFFILWQMQAGIKAGMDPAEAIKRGGMLMGIVQTMALVWAPVIGILIDKMNRVTGLIIAMTLAAAGYSFMALISDPMSNTIYIAAVLLGMGEMSAVISSQSLMGQEAPLEIRGAVFGIFSFAGAMGILTVNALGGYLFDNWMQQAPFMMMGIANGILLLFAIIVRIKAGDPSDYAESQTHEQI